MTPITLPRAAAQQALEALEKSRVFVTTREKIKHPEGTEWYDGTITALRAALAQQEEGRMEFNVKETVCATCGSTNGAHSHDCPVAKAALAQQAEPDHETRAELAEQQVVQLAEERDHYRNLWQKAQQAEPVDTDCHTQGICQRSGYGIPKP